MTIQPIPGFKNFYTHHCVTGSLAEIYQFHGHAISEDMLLGLGEGVGYIYWHQKGDIPFIGGRSQPKPSMEEITAQRTGVKSSNHTTTSARKAKRTLLAQLAAGQPVMLQVDMGYLPYFDFGGEEYHFGGHAVVACGYNAESDTVLISDRDDIYPVPMADLEKARGSTFKPFPPKNRWLTFDFSQKRQPTPEELRIAISNMATLMLEPPISNIGVKGIRKTAVLLPQWHSILTPEQLKWALFNTYIFISPVGGSGGGAFRYMLSRFLGETASILQDTCFETSAQAFHKIADAWEEIANWSKEVSKSEDPASRLEEAKHPIQTIADLEEEAWTKVLEFASEPSMAHTSYYQNI